MNKKCIFCKIKKKKSLIVDENKFFFIIRDSYPVTKYHSLIIIKKHIQSFFKIKPSDLKNCFSLLTKQQIKLKKIDPKIKGFNVGFNDGKFAGQTVNHFHLHLIPRRKGDQKNPKGGVRGVIPSRQKY